MLLFYQLFDLFADRGITELYQDRYVDFLPLRSPLVLQLISKIEKGEAGLSDLGFKWAIFPKERVELQFNPIK